MNVAWSLDKVHSSVNYVNPRISDHSPMILDTALECVIDKGSFKFFDHLVEHPQFMEIVGQVLCSESRAKGFRSIV